MKRFPPFKKLKRMSVLNKPMSIADVADIDADGFEDRWLLQVDKIHAKQLRRFRHQATT